MSKSRLQSALCLGVVFALASCLSTSVQPELTPPAYEANLLHFAGDSLSGPLSTAEDLTTAADEAIAVTVELFFLSKFPSHALTSLSGKADLHSADGRDPIRVVPGSSALARVGFGDDAQEFRASLKQGVTSLAKFDTVLPPGVTLAVELRTTHDAFAAELARIKDTIRPALISYVAESTMTSREVSVLAETAADELQPLALLAPAANGGAILWWFEKTSEPENPQTAEAHRVRFDQCMENVRSSSAAVIERIQPLEQSDLEVRRLAGAVDALDVVRFHRPALIFLASQSGAPTARDVAWLADDEFLGACVQRVLSTLKGLESRAGREQTAWRLERACYRELAARFAEDTLPNELISILFRHAGELGRYPGLLDDVLIASNNQEELVKRLTAENKLFLEDRNPAARVRAFDWLEARKAAPAAYDPLANREQRRAALAEVAQ